jgi:hypothetical protein
LVPPIGPRGVLLLIQKVVFFIQSEAVQKKFIEIFEKDWEERSEPAQRLTVIEKVVAAGMGILDNVY